MADYTPYKVTSYDDWKKNIQESVSSDSDYQAAKAKLEETTNNKPVYAGTYDNDVANAYNNIVNREKFQYNLDDDALYKQYADKYMAAGKLAMKNSMGQSAALTGGYGSSYGAAVGQQTYDAYLQGLNDKALEMYDRAYQRYQDEGDRLKDIYGLASDMANTEYGRYTDLLGQYNTDRSFDYGAMQDAYNNAYNRDVQAYSRYTNDESIMSDYAYNLAAQGDFSLLEQMFGTEAANNARTTWSMQNPDAAFARGLISADQYANITGKYPIGYEPAAEGGGGGGYGGGSTKKKTGSGSDYSGLEANYSGSGTSLAPSSGTTKYAGDTPTTIAGKIYTSPTITKLSTGTKTTTTTKKKSSGGGGR